MLRLCYMWNNLTLFTHSKMHAGNKWYREIIKQQQPLYWAAKTKSPIAEAIMSAMEERCGRFLDKEKSTGRWYIVNRKRAMEKVKQALREKKGSKETTAAAAITNLFPRMPQNQGFGAFAHEFDNVTNVFGPCQVDPPHGGNIGNLPFEYQNFSMADYSMDRPEVPADCTNEEQKQKLQGSNRHLHSKRQQLSKPIDEIGNDAVETRASHYYPCLSTFIFQPTVTNHNRQVHASCTPIFVFLTFR